VILSGAKQSDYGGYGYPSEDEHLNRNRNNHCPIRPPTSGTPDCQGRTFNWYPVFRKYRVTDGSECAYDSGGSLLSDQGGNYTYNYTPNPIAPSHICFGSAGT